MITAIAKLTAVEGKEAELEAALTAMVKAVSDKEPGVATYSLHVSDDDPRAFLFYEQYESAEAQKEHGQTPHMAELGGKLRGLLDGRLEVARYTQVAGVER